MSECYRFGPFEMRLAKRELLLIEGARLIGLGVRAFDVLVCLVQNYDRLVSKADLLKTVWGTLVVEENNLSVRVAAIHQALGKRAIVTVAQRGFRFGWPVQALATSFATGP